MHFDILEAAAAADFKYDSQINPFDILEAAAAADFKYRIQNLI